MISNAFRLGREVNQVVCMEVPGLTWNQGSHETRAHMGPNGTWIEMDLGLEGGPDLKRVGPKRPGPKYH